MGMESADVHTTHSTRTLPKVNTIFSKKQSHLKLEQTDGKKKMIVCIKTKQKPAKTANSTNRLLHNETSASNERLLKNATENRPVSA
jgi:hypothetical protein